MSKPVATRLPPPAEERVELLTEENRQLRARVAELEKSCVNLASENIEKVFSEPPMRAWLLRKQAEAVEDFLEWANDYCSGWAQDDAGRTYWHDAQIKGFAKGFRQQADEAEKAGGER